MGALQAVCEKRLRRRDTAAQQELTERQGQRLVTITVSMTLTQVRLQEQLRAINRVLANPEAFKRTEK